MPTPEPIASMVAYLIGSVQVAGIPYAAFAIGMGVWVGRRTPAELPALSRRMPLFFLLFLFAWIAIPGALFGDGLWRDLPSVFAIVGFFVIVIGYGYVAVVELLRWVGDRRGWFTDTRSA